MTEGRTCVRPSVRVAADLDGEARPLRTPLPTVDQSMIIAVDVAVIAIVPVGEREIAEEIADRRTVARNVGIVVRRLRVRQVVAAVG